MNVMIEKESKAEIQKLHLLPMVRIWNLANWQMTIKGL